MIITRNGAISELNQVTVIPTTTHIREIESQVILDEADGMDEICALNLDWIQTIPKSKLRSFITLLSDERMKEVFEATKYAFGFDK